MTAAPTSALAELLRRGRAPLGPPVRVDFGPTTGPLSELAEVLVHTNGFTVFNAGIQLFHAGPRGLGPELAVWNARGTWKDTYAGLVDRLLCFAQDLLAVQFAIAENCHVVAVDPETAGRTILGDSLDAWAQWLLDDPDVHGTWSLATAWQDTPRPIKNASSRAGCSCSAAATTPTTSSPATPWRQCGFASRWPSACTTPPTAPACTCLAHDHHSTARSRP
ncbi:hypothetical protein [Gandjariella thermophila]|uniref:Uncharacterized protein n=1 Tax=Gandjariella thermophila TaxID=1931992 RepID=A0A4D4J8W6_9PSEU|nr:hypothetical protein [Gandjariella thermophila]GDY31108.1 hypothetical protein GTS_27410 [Gandjariella thermophila]